MNFKMSVIGTFVGLLLGQNAYSCSVLRVVSNVEMVRNADAIAVVTAEDYAYMPKNPWGGLLPNSTIRFKVAEVIKGQLTTDHLILPGVLVDKDDFNDHPSPYTFVRPEGRHGNCYAISYRTGGRFLLMLKKDQQGHLTVYWCPLAPANEQLHSMDDPWLFWVRKQVKPIKLVNRQT